MFLFVTDPCVICLRHSFAKVLCLINTLRFQSRLFVRPIFSILYHK